ncbi:hypothetical protein EJ02DRAFT_438638 [Clathrospora elynae]|uniref:Uncharacterized protein n=1 Tax=Clathrospora elynae TaxID=706981 RepID=A0A6A5S9S8_9PLEO|nr:hypothetical protein EJ02DRAFT_438638 [Clathrospora elynae]
MKAFTTVLAFVGLVTTTLAYNNGDQWCCSNWFGCEYVDGIVKNIHGCQKGTHCVYDNRNFRCDKATASAEAVLVPEVRTVAAPRAAAPEDAAPANSSNNGDKWCCSSWFGCECVDGKAKTVKPCGKGTHCVYDNGNFRCDKGTLDVVARETREKRLAIARDNTTSASECHPGLFCEESKLMACSPDHKVTMFRDCGLERCVMDGHSIPHTRCEKREVVQARPSAPLAARVNTICGICNSVDSHLSYMYANGFCNNADPNDTTKRYSACKNDSCGICMIFAGRDCQGDITATPPKYEGYKDVHKGQSYYCY